MGMTLVGSARSEQGLEEPNGKKSVEEKGLWLVFQLGKAEKGKLKRDLASLR